MSNDRTRSSDRTNVIRYPRPNTLGLVSGINYGHPNHGTASRPNHAPGVFPQFYGKPIDTPTGHKWAGYATDASRR